MSAEAPALDLTQWAKGAASALRNGSKQTQFELATELVSALYGEDARSKADASFYAVALRLLSSVLGILFYKFSIIFLYDKFCHYKVSVYGVFPLSLLLDPFPQPLMPPPALIV